MNQLCDWVNHYLTVHTYQTITSITKSLKTIAEMD